MTPKQQELIVKYLSDISKGMVLAVVVGLGTQKVSWLYVLVALLAAGGFLLGAYWLEGDQHDA